MVPILILLAVSTVLSGNLSHAAQPICPAMDENVLKELALGLVESDLAGVRLTVESPCVAKLRAEQAAAPVRPKIRVVRDPIQDLRAILALGLSSVADDAKVRIIKVRRLDEDTASAEYSISGVKKKGTIQFLLDTDAEKQETYGCARLLSIKGPWRVRESCMP